MKLEGRRESTNVEDRRGSGRTSLGGGLGISGIILVALITWLMGGNPLDALQGIDPGSLMTVTEQSATGTFSAQEEELATFSKQILAGTEDVWGKIFKEQLGATYEPPKMVLYTGSVRTGCGNGSSSMGPFYCSADETVYIDLSFFTQMKRQLGVDGDFAYAYVIAHEVGHHVQHLLGILDKAHAQMAQINEKEANKISVRLELQADYFAGLWAYHDNRMFSSLEDGDLEEAISCAEVIGDNYLQEKARGYSMPDSFTHGTSAQRMKWLKLGLSTGDLQRGNDIFRLDYRKL